MQRMKEKCLLGGNERGGKSGYEGGRGKKGQEKRRKQESNEKRISSEDLQIVVRLGGTALGGEGVGVKWWGVGDGGD